MSCEWFCGLFGRESVIKQKILEEKIVNKYMIEDLKNGVRIMSIEARYLYSANKKMDSEHNEIGYDTSRFWDEKSNKKKVPDGLYKVKMPYSLGLEKMYEIQREEFKVDDYDIVYSDMVINVIFKGAAKRKKQLKRNKKGEIKEPKPKYIIKTYGTGKNQSTLKKVSRLETELNTEGLREHMYENGFVLNGNKYVYFMRSTSKSRCGNMLFIKEEYCNDLLIQWARLGITFSETESIDIAGIKSYESLVLSGICGKLEIRPEEILLINDFESIFNKKSSVTKLDDNDRLKVVDEVVEYHNSIWDGMSLMDASKYNEFTEFENVKEGNSLKGKSFVLLRNLWFKSAAFNFNIQKYFNDHNVTMDDVKKHGWTIAEDISQIKLITTPNSLKILKVKDYVENRYEDRADGDIQNMFEYWLDSINGNPYFGVVKSEHGIYGHDRRCNSQILMALPLSKDDMRTLLDMGEIPYLSDMRNDEDMFLMHLGANKSINNNMIYELAAYVPGIIHTDLYKRFKNDTLNDYKENWKKDGIKIPDSDFCVCVSNPMEMIQYASGIDPDAWDRVHNGREAYCKTYDNGQELIAARNPCVSSGNIVCLKNTKNAQLNEYMTLSDNIVVVNSIESDIMERCSGMDYDSDQLWISSNELLVEKAKYCEKNFLTPVNKVSKETKEKFNVVKDLVGTDSKIAKGKVGDIVNMGQILQAYYWHIYFEDTPESEEERELRKFIYDKISMLSSASNVEIDRAKREYKMDTDKELADLRRLGLDSESDFLAKFMSYGKLLGVRKQTLTEAELKDHPDIEEAYNAIEKYRNIEAERPLNNEERELKDKLYRLISDFLLNKHKKDDNKAAEKIKKPLYFKYAFPNSVENSVYFDEGMNCPMDNLCILADNKEILPKKKTKDRKIDIMELIKETDKRGNDKHRAKIKEIAEEYSKYCSLKKTNSQYSIINGLTKKDYFEQCVKQIRKINVTQATIIEIFNACYGSKQATSHNKEITEIKKYMIDLIYAAHKERVLECFDVRTVFGRKYFKQMYLVPLEKKFEKINS